MKILVVGGGGREHAIVKALSKSSRKPVLYCAPGNAGISELAECVDINAMEIDKIVSWVKENKIDLVVVAPDDPLAAGLVDRIESEGVRAFGPRQNAAMIESSKVFSKGLMKKYKIPTAEYEIFHDYNNALEYVKTLDSFPVFIKADGLAVGKGAIMAQDYFQAKDAIEKIMQEKIFGESGNNIVIEEYLTGKEITVLLFTDGKTIRPMVSSQDHKRAFDGDEGPNTGGMGAFSPVGLYTPELAEQCMSEIYKPTINAMSAEGRLFKGVLYSQLMITKEGPKVIEFNARFGDPEAQVVLPRLKTDLIDIFDAVIDSKLDEIEIEWDDKAAVCVVVASGGYPVSYETGKVISGVEKAESLPGITIYHAGTKSANGNLLTAGGRVLGVTAHADTLAEARQNAYKAVEHISFDGAFYRKDIAK